MRHICSRGFVPAAALALVLGVGASVPALPASSPAIVVGQGILGAKLGDTPQQVRAHLGKPAFITAPAYDGTVEWGYPKKLMGIIGFDHTHHVYGMWTSNPKLKTNKGIGPKSSYAKFRHAYPKVKCIAGPFGPKSLECDLKSRYHGHSVITAILFYTKALGVREIDIDFV